MTARDADGPAGEDVTIIEPPLRRPAIGLREVWSYRELLYQLATREIRARYKQSLLGKAWIILQPLAMLGLYYVVFGQVLRIRSGAIPYPLFLLSGIVLWQLFASAATQASLSLTSNAHLMSKVYFPRLVMPLAGMLSSLVDFAFTLLVLLGFFVALRQIPAPTAPVALLFALLAAWAGLTFGLWLSPLNVEYRDIQQLIPLTLQSAMYLTPVVYPANLVPASWQGVYYLNPMAGIIEGFRWSLLGGEAPPLSAAWGALILVALFVVGLLRFRRQESLLADAL